MSKLREILRPFMLKVGMEEQLLDQAEYAIKDYMHSLVPKNKELDAIAKQFGVGSIEHGHAIWYNQAITEMLEKLK